jgi:hypothetical protein
MPPRKKTTSSRKKAEAAPPPQERIPLGMTQDCLMCPFGLLFFALRNTRPEVMEHLTKGAQELLFAFRAVADQAAERWEKADAGLQRISVR